MPVVEADVDALPRALLADSTIPKVTFTKYDSVFLKRHGVAVNGPYHDLQVMAWVLNENQLLDLGSVTKKYLGYDPDKRLKRSGGRVWFTCDDGKLVPIADAPRDQLFSYNRRDVEASVELYRTLRELMVETEWETYFLDECVPVTEVLTDMEVAGLPVDLQASEELRIELEGEAARLNAELLAEASLPSSLNLGSNDQMRAFLFNRTFELKDAIELAPGEAEAVKACIAGDHDDCPEGGHLTDCIADGFDVGKVGQRYAHGVWTLRGLGYKWEMAAPKCERGECEHGRGKHSPAVSTPALMTNLQAAADPWVKKYIHWRKIEKVLTTYLRPMPERVIDGRVYGRFNQTGTKTGRLSSSGPNLQNLPAHGDLGPRVRRLFTGNLIVGDYSMLEVRLAAHFSGDEVLTQAFRDGTDPYLDLAHALFGGTYAKGDAERDIAKTVLLGSQYGAGAKKLATILALNGFPTPHDKAQDYLNDLHALYATLYRWKEAVIAQAKSKGYVTTLSGRHRRLKANFKDGRNWKLIGYGERQAVNAVVQGSAADIVQRVMWRGNWQVEQHLLAQVHDELVWEWDTAGGPNDHQLAYIKSEAETCHAFDLRVPLVFDVGVGSSWYAAKSGDSAIELPEEDD